MDRRVAEARLGQVLCGKDTLERVLGVGGTAAVYLATHRNGHKAAVKLLHPHLAAYEGFATLPRAKLVDDVTRPARQ
ncbi:MAG TPA: hypothetical protein PLR99_20595 [Polyangiaceae bacterium]|nr:hypothetical protein [Polyangiaceae bacterium]